AEVMNGTGLVILDTSTLNENAGLNQETAGGMLELHVYVTDDGTLQECGTGVTTCVMPTTITDNTDGAAVGTIAIATGSKLLVDKIGRAPCRDRAGHSRLAGSVKNTDAHRTIDLETVNHIIDRVAEVRGLDHYHDVACEATA